MIDKILSPGNKIELQSNVNVVLPDGTHGVKTYASAVYDIFEDGMLGLLMPTEQQKIVLLPVNGEYNVRFYTKSGVYRADVRIVDRQKMKNVYILVAELTTKLQKFQRREYYRFSCMIGMKARELTEEEKEAINKGLMDDVSEFGMRPGVMMDISGGGLRFVSKYSYNVGSTILVEFSLPINNTSKLYRLAANVVGINPIEGKYDYEIRLKYEFMNKKTQEEIVKYIFDAERNSRKTGKS